MGKKRFQVDDLKDYTIGLFAGEEVRVRYSEGYGKDGKATTHIYIRKGQYVYERLDDGQLHHLRLGDLTAFDPWSENWMLNSKDSFLVQVRKAVKAHCDFVDSITNS